MLMVLNLLMNSLTFAVGEDVTSPQVESGVMELEGIELGGESEETVQEEVREYEIGDQTEMLLSDILKQLEWELPLKDIMMVLVLGSAREDELPAPTVDPETEVPTELMNVSPVGEDFRIEILKPFDRAGLEIYTEDAIYPLYLIGNVDLPVKEVDELSLWDEETGLEILPQVDYVYDMVGTSTARLSDIAWETGMPLTIDDVEMVGLLGGTDGSLVNIEQVEGDYVIDVLADFESEALAVYTAHDFYALTLTNGRAPEPAGEPTEEPTGEPTETPTDKLTEETAGETTEETAEALMGEPTEGIVDRQTDKLSDEPMEEDAEPLTGEPMEGPADDADLIVIGPVAPVPMPRNATEDGEASEMVQKSASASYDTEHLCLSLDGKAEATATLRRMRLDTDGAKQMLEAYAIVSSRDCDGIDVSIIHMPELQAGEYLALYGIVDDALTERPVADHLSEGDSFSFAVEKWQGFALARLGLMEYQALEPIDVEDAIIELRGTLPVGVSVETKPVEGYEVEGEALLAYDIKLRDAGGNAFQPAEGAPVEVTLRSDTLRAALVGGSEINVWHWSDGATDPEAVEVVSMGDDAITFAAKAFSVYAVEAIVLQKTMIASDGNTYQITVAYDTASGIPADAALDVREILADDEAYADYVAQTAEALDVDESALMLTRAFDIALTGPDGARYQPMKGVKVSIELLDAEIDADTRPNVVHFGDAAEALACAMNGDAVEFETDGFSVYVVTYTVDFHWEGYTYNLAGEGSITLSALLGILGASDAEDANADSAQLLALAEDMSQIEDVTFSDPALVSVEKTPSEASEDDWLLTSLAPFDTEETLTLALVDGSEIVIRVTDEVAEGDAVARVSNDGANWRYFKYLVNGGSGDE